jgi:hypothetical protein
MEDILDLYAEPYQPAFPVICFDEMPYQMVSETQLPWPMQSGIPFVMTLNIDGKAPATCLCFYNPWLVGGT